jgi:endonuclease-8
MPEGPSIVILKEESMIFLGKKVLSVSGNSKAGIDRIVGKKIRDIQSFGKQFLISFPGFYIRIHLLMFGTYRINERKETEPRLSMKFSKGEFNFYSCALKIVEGDPADDYDWSLDTMSPSWDHDKAVRQVRSDGSRIISDVLLDQLIFAGVGNIIKVEVLFLSRIHPEARVRNIPAGILDGLIRVTRDYCFQFYHWKKRFELRKNFKIYRQKLCPRCGNKIKIKYVGLTDRRTFFCDCCQYLTRKELTKLRIKK